MVDHGGCIGRRIEHGEQLRRRDPIFDAGLQLAGLQSLVRLGQHPAYEAEVVQDLDHPPLGDLPTFLSQLLSKPLDRRLHHAQVIVLPVVTMVACREVMAHRELADDRRKWRSGYKAFFDLLPVRDVQVLQFATYRAG